MPLTYPYKQYGGVWTLSQASDAIAQGKWPVPPAPHLYAWGQNNYGQLGLGNITSYSSPKQVGNLTIWLNISSGQYYTSAIKTDGTLWTWGLNNSGQLGLNNTTNYSSPKQVGSLTNWSLVASSSGTTLAIKTDGTLWSWGANSNGQLGLGNRTNYSSPKQVGSLTNWLTVVTQNNSTLAIKTDGTLWSWGLNAYGQLGLQNTTYYSSPKQVGASTNWSKVTTAYYGFTIAIKTDGTIWSWGRNNNGQLGLGNITYYSSPKQIGALTTWSKLSQTKWSSTLAIKTDGTLWGWGTNNVGQLGTGAVSNYSSPKQIGSLNNWSFVEVGLFSLAIKTDGTLWGWGDNSQGQLGLSNTTGYSSPKQIGALTSWSNASVGKLFSQTIAIT